MEMGLITVAIGVALAAVSCSGSQGRWTAFVYPPDASTQEVRHAVYGDYDTFERCQAAAVAALRDKPPVPGSEDVGSYECGRACRYDVDMDMYVCDQTRK